MNNGDKLDRSEQLKKRTKQFALRVIHLFKAIPRGEEARIIGRQVLRSGTSIGANYPAACEHALQRSLYPRYELWLKKPMKLFIGWNYWSRRRLLQREGSRTCTLKPMSCSQYLQHLNARPRPDLVRQWSDDQIIR